MTQPLNGIAQNFSEEELKVVLRSIEVRNGTHGFTGLECSCGIRANVPVSFLWTSSWTCSCTTTNRIEGTEMPSPWNDPTLGPSKGILNQILGTLGLRKY